MKYCTPETVPIPMPANDRFPSARLASPPVCESVASDGVFGTHFVGADDRAIFEAAQTLIERGPCGRDKIAHPHDISGQYTLSGTMRVGPVDRANDRPSLTTSAGLAEEAADG